MRCMKEKNFKDYRISPEIIRALSGLQYITPTKVQEEVIPFLLENRDLVVKSQTGSGKTAAYGIPLCEMVEWEENKPQVLILTPTRELAAQVKEDITNIGRFKRIKVAAIFGKQSFAKQKLELKQKTHIVVGTPGRLMDHIQKGTLLVDRIEYLIIDEADEMLNMGFIDQVESIIQALPSDRVTNVFSATFPEDIKTLCYKHMKNPMEIEINQQTSPIKNVIDQIVIEVQEKNKFSLLKDITITENPDSCIIFCRTQEQVNNVLEQLDVLDYPCDKIHGGMYQEDRFEVMDDFKRGEFRYLVATDVAARGIDIEDISLVINYDIPLEKESYVHRIGRTGRAGKKGKAITFMTPFEDRFLREIENYVGYEIPKVPSPTEEDVSKVKKEFIEKIHATPILKEDKSIELNKDIMKLYFNGGKKKKIRPVDFVGTIANIEGLTVEDIGIINIQENTSFVEILNGKGPIVLKAMKNKTVKGKKLKVHEAR